MLHAENMTSQPEFNILFLCTGNSARSLIAEGLMRHLSQGRIGAYSAGSFPTGAPHPNALEILSEHQVDIHFARSKSWGEFAGADSPEMDVIITVCDNAAGESCPLWPGHPATAHWGVADPAAVTGSADQVRVAFLRTYQQFHARITTFLSTEPYKMTAGEGARMVSSHFPSEPSLPE